VSGTSFVDGNGNVIQPRGVDRSGTEYACSQNFGFSDGPIDEASVQAMAAWHINMVRIPMNEDCWLGINGVNPTWSGANYQNAVANFVSLLNKYGIYADLDLACGWGGTTVPCTVNSSQPPMPDTDHSPMFWSQVATAFENNPAVIFDLWNEPFPDNGGNTAADWTCWRDGGNCADVPYTAAGMQQLVTAIRDTGATNVITVPGLAWASQFDQFAAYLPSDPARQLAADFHNYSWVSCNTASCWDTLQGQIGNMPLFTGEVGFDSYIETYMSWADSHGIGYLAWTWDTWGCSGGQALISGYSGTPCSPYGTGFQQHLAARASQP
jgi:aryl-phospho-beta-D-glucosidase BglC (GH1 family)